MHCRDHRNPNIEILDKTTFWHLQRVSTVIGHLRQHRALMGSISISRYSFVGGWPAHVVLLNFCRCYALVFGNFCVSEFCCVRKFNWVERNYAQEPAPDFLLPLQRKVALNISGSYDRPSFHVLYLLTEIESSQIALGNSSKHIAQALECLRSTRILTCVGQAPEIRSMSMDFAHCGKNY
jgi:hypothetical protein